VHNYKQVYLQWIICIFIQIKFINIQNLQYKTLSCKPINLFLYRLLLDIQKNYLQDSFIGSSSSKGPTFSKNSYMLTWKTCRLRQLEIKMSLSVIHCMSSDSIWEWTAGTSTQQMHSSGVVIEELLPHSHDICSISVLFLPNCIVKPFISFTTCVSGTTLSVPSVYFISICIYFINVPHGIFCHVMLALYVSNVSYFLGVNVAIVPQCPHIRCDWLIKNRHL
jgi:hypothetical protein